MTTTINTRKTYRFELELDEVNAINEVNRLIKDIQNTIGDEAMIVSQTTGELIETENLCRMRGVLDALLVNNGTTWDELN